ncbi:hypothetical protein MSG28_012178 [Choristoneura fumiferana]|uniref:Uncharacterized protein n=1 Tax=Choristoneura fumiferana TaxID=7141 RepID=A0ACC0KCP1_CHOFU|nr:hypothetical protein MSG28_012178 [Choristoneura fumiferana]
MIRVIFLVTCIIFLYFDNTSSSHADEFESVFAGISDATLSEDGKLNFSQLATKYGHSADQYNLTTEDGYILTLFNLPGNGPSVLLFHGLADTSDTFIIRGNTSLAITSANAGYNVWVGNSRGNKYGRRHVNLNPDTDKEEFWNFSFHEIGYYDLAATIDFIRNKTGEDSIATIGHSQGTTAHYVLASTRPEYNERIKVTISLAPIAFLSNLAPPVSLVVDVGPAIFLLLKSLGMEEILQDRKALSNIVTLICSKGLISYALCGFGALFPFFGVDPSNIEPEFLRTIFGHYPAATSRKSLVHFDQVYLRKRFSQYDYGMIKNLAKYGSTAPPDYDLSAITAKIALVAGKNDQLSKVKDVEHLKDRLTNVVHYEVLKPKLWSHVDFVWAKTAPVYLYPTIFNILKKHV